MSTSERRVRIFQSFQEAEAADREFYKSLTPEQRLDILLELIARHGSSEGLQRIYRVLERQRG
ncbi:MAG: hypothetical protein RMK57_09110 [Bryobacterales bacterium]|nr:hypothetical protein [Bryobacteraceae bacterium]MDW8354674.1 hypothetical protein [Bryobacterales bacterium]